LTEEWKPEDLFPVQNQIDETYEVWRKRNQALRVREVAELEERLETLLNQETNEYYYTSKAWEQEKQARTDLRWQWEIDRRIRELIRWEREDLKWEWELQRREVIRNRFTGTRPASDTRSAQTERAKRNRQHKKRSTTKRNARIQKES